MAFGVIPSISVMEGWALAICNERHAPAIAFKQPFMSAPPFSAAPSPQHPEERLDVRVRRLVPVVVEVRRIAQRAAVAREAAEERLDVSVRARAAVVVEVRRAAAAQVDDRGPRAAHA